MSYSQVFTEKDGYLLCISDGVIGDADVFIEWGVKTVAETVGTGNNKILLDNRTVRLELTPFDEDRLMNVAVRLRELFHSHCLRNPDRFSSPAYEPWPISTGTAIWHAG